MYHSGSGKQEYADLDVGRYVCGTTIDVDKLAK